jgi:hypothetical protein
MKYGEFKKPTDEIILILKINNPNPIRFWAETSKFQSSMKSEWNLERNCQSPMEKINGR